MGYNGQNISASRILSAAPQILSAQLPLGCSEWPAPLIILRALSGLRIVLSTISKGHIQNIAGFGQLSHAATWRSLGNTASKYSLLINKHSLFPLIPEAPAWNHLILALNLVLLPPPNFSPFLCIFLVAGGEIEVIGHDQRPTAYYFSIYAFLTPVLPHLGVLLRGVPLPSCSCNHLNEIRVLGFCLDIRHSSHWWNSRCSKIHIWKKYHRWKTPLDRTKDTIKALKNSLDTFK